MVQRADGCTSDLCKFANLPNICNHHRVRVGHYLVLCRTLNSRYIQAMQSAVTKIMKSEAEVFVYGGTALTMGPAGIVQCAVIGIAQGRIVSIQSDPHFQPPKETRNIDARGCLVMPGLINGHTHVGMTLLRGIADDLPLNRWLQDYILPLERQWGSPEFVTVGAELACLELIRSGTTLFNDIYYHPDKTAEVVKRAGLRAILGLDIFTEGTDKERQDFLKRYENLASQIDSALIEPALGPHSVYGVHEKAWKEIITFASKKKIKVHLHLSENMNEVDQCRTRYGTTPVGFLDRLGLWESCKAIGAHGVILEPSDMEILARYHVPIVHNPESNLKLETKICPVTRLRSVGVPVLLGTDSTASNNNLNLIEAARFAVFLQSYDSGAGSLTAEQAVRLMTIEGARALGYGEDLGSLEVGKSADLIVIDIQKPHAVPLYNPYSHIIYCAEAADTQHVLVNGKILMENRKVLTLDDEEILKRARSWGVRLQSGSRA